MRHVNREGFLVVPRKPYWAWVKRTVPGMPGIPPPSSAVGKGALFLVPESATVDVLSFAKKHYRAIFRNELAGWTADRTLWPDPIDCATFLEWFDVEPAVEVFDLAKEDLTSEKW